MKVKPFARALAATALALPLLALAPSAARAQAPADEVEKVRKQAERIEKAVAELRGLEFRSPVEKGIKTREELRAFYGEELKKEMPDAELEKLQKAYVKIGLIPRGYELKTRLLALLGEQIAGFYDPEKKQLFLIGKADDPQQEIVMAHELTHALQDQHFDLLTVQKSRMKEDDRMAAAKAMIEGEATLAMLGYTLRERFGGGMDLEQLPDLGPFLKLQERLGSLLGGAEELASAPAFIRENLTFSYLDGAAFVQKGLKRGGWKGLDRMWGDLPESTEQILHPEKYDAGEHPVAVTLPADVAAQMGAGWSVPLEDTFGELELEIWLREAGVDEIGRASCRERV